MHATLDILFIITDFSQQVCALMVHCFQDRARYCVTCGIIVLQGSRFCDSKALLKPRTPIMESSVDYTGPTNYQVLKDRPGLADYIEAADTASRCGDNRAVMAIIEMIYARFDEHRAVGIKIPEDQDL